MKNKTGILLLVIGFCILIFLIAQMFVMSEALGFELNEVGYGFSGGYRIAKDNISILPATDSKFEYGKLSAIVEKPLSKNWYYNIEPGIGLHRSWNDNEDKYGVSLGVNLWLFYDVIHIGKNGSIYIGPGGGLMTMLPASNQPELGASGVLGFWSVRVGYRHKMDKLLVSTSLGFEHISDVFDQGDQGRNFIALSMTFIPCKGR